MDTSAPRFVSLFELRGTHTAEVAMAARAIVERVDVIGYVLDRERAVLVDVLLNPLLLQAALGQADRSIHVTGTVESVQPHLWRSAIAVAPLLTARGVQNKVLEAQEPAGLRRLAVIRARNRGSFQSGRNSGRIRL